MRSLRYSAFEAAALRIRTPFVSRGQQHERSLATLALAPLPNTGIAMKASKRVLKALNRLVGPAVHR